MAEAIAGRAVSLFPRECANRRPETEQKGNEEVDDSFYKFTAEDYRRVAAGYARRAAQNARFVTRAKRMEMHEKKVNAAGPATIRVLFPDGNVLQAKFHARETLAALADVVGKCLLSEVAPFYLYTAPPKKAIEDLKMNFFDAGFVPGALVYFAMEPREGCTEERLKNGPFLRPEILAIKQEVEPPREPPRKEQSQVAKEDAELRTKEKKEKVVSRLMKMLKK